METIINSARKVIDEMNQCIATADNCSAVLPEIMNTEIIARSKDGRTIDFVKLLDEYQRGGLLCSIYDMIQENQNNALDKLKRITSANAPESSEKEEKAENDKSIVKAEKEQNKANEEKKMGKDTLEEQIRLGKSVNEIAEYFGYKESYVKATMTKYGLQAKEAPKSKRQPKESDVQYIKTFYTEGKKTLSEVAGDLDVSKKELHEFVKQHKLEKPAWNC